ncbi:MAG TPA: ThiF family adenylyltransferase [Terriglobia bacterium]|nr:ThiF family adenylyltransferase [Terriglobia bacterium]
METGKYSRQILFAPIGREGQERLRAAKVVILGCGALGTAQANLLARAGIGVLRIIDRDYVEESNLQRQILFDESDAAQRFPKAAAAERKLRQINSDVSVEGLVEDAQPHNIEGMVAGFDLILDGTDNFETRFLLNDIAVKLGIPWIYGAVVAAYGVTMTVLPGRACLSCVMPRSPEGIHETCDTAGVIGPAVNWVIAVQMAEALKILSGQVSDLHQQLISYDVWTNRLQQLAMPRDPECRACARRKFTYLEGKSHAQLSLCGRDAVQIRQRELSQVDLDALKQRLAQFGPVRGNSFLVQCALEPYEITVFGNGRTIVKGTQDPALARSLYARYVGS